MTVARAIDRLVALILFVVAVWWPASPACAAGAGQPWRGTYDTVMIWVNFILLIVVLVKFLRRPIRDFVEEQRGQVAKGIERAEQKKAEAAESLKTLEASLADREQTFQALRDRIVRQGERERDDLVADAREQAERLIETTRRRVDTHIREAAARLKEELVEAAIDRVFVELPSHMGPEDYQTWIDRFIDGISDKTGALSGP